ncbi:MAG TPA: hypothetical protein PKD18_21950 [Saprospiraceae bacterium]|mgnify:CR=1 FL=1|nr:hypothetical protein [Saprospiraceae bacterium]
MKNFFSCITLTVSLCFTLSDNLSAQDIEEGSFVESRRLNIGLSFKKQGRIYNSHNAVCQNCTPNLFSPSRTARNLGGFVEFQTKTKKKLSYTFAIGYNQYGGQNLLFEYDNSDKLLQTSKLGRARTSTYTVAFGLRRRVLQKQSYKLYLGLENACLYSKSNSFTYRAQTKLEIEKTAPTVQLTMPFRVVILHRLIFGINLNLLDLEIYSKDRTTPETVTNYYIPGDFNILNNSILLGYNF